MKIFLLLLLCAFQLPLVVQARPEYANRHGINRCTACHFSPAGGGLRNTNGKLYGSHGFKISKYASQDFVSAEMRFVHYNPKGDGLDSEGRGLALMAGIIGGSVAITPEEDSEATEIRAVFSHDVYNNTPWATYIRFRRYEDTQTGWLPQYIVAGRFHAPFGIMTDEHRTYVKLQTVSDYNKKLESGAMFSAQPYDSFHYDIAIVNGEANNATFANKGNAELWGGLANLRWISKYSWLPLTFGMSYKYYDQAKNQHKPWAASAYSLISLERLSGGWMRADLMFEYAQAKYLNDVAATSAGFPNATGTYYANILDSTSSGFFGQLNYYLSEKLVLQLKHDQLLYNRDYSADAYQKFGIGLKHHFAANSFFMYRWEKAEIGQPDEEKNPFHRAEDAVWAYLQVGI